MLKTVVVPLDGSELAERALPYGVRLARESGAEILLVRAAHTAAAAVVTNASAARIAAARLAAEKAEAQTELGKVAERLREEGLTVTTTVDVGAPDDAILEITRANDSSLIVMATHGRSGVGRYLFGSVADAVLRQAQVPVLLVRPATDQPWPTDRAIRILVPLDGSELAEEALDPACELAEILSGELRLLRVIPVERVPRAHTELPARIERSTAYLEAVAARLREQGRVVSMQALMGTPAPTIASAAADDRADLIVMASHGRSGLARFVLGSVAIGVLQHATAPVMVVRPAAIRAANPAEEPLPPLLTFA